MNQTLTVVTHEVRLLWKEFKFSAKIPLTRILIFVLILAVIIVNLTLGFTLYAIFDVSPALGERLLGSLNQFGLTSSVIADIVYFLLLMLLISSFAKGVTSSNFGLLFTRTDENIIFPSPIAPHASYVAKKFRGFMLHGLTIATVLIAGFPLVTRVGFQGLRLVVLFFTLLALLEIYGFTENISYCISRVLPRRGARRNVLALMAFVAWTIFIVASPFLLVLGGDSIAFLTYLYPPSACSIILALNPSFNITLAVLSLLGEVILLLLVSSTIAGLGLRAWTSSPRLVQTRSNFIRLKRDRLMWKTGKRSSTRLLLMKDFWVTIRNPSKFFIPLAISLILLLFAIGLNTVLPFQSGQLAIQQSAEALFVPSIYLVTAFILSPAWDSFASERHTLFILKSSPIRTSRIIWSKYLFGLIRSASYTVPLVVAISLLLPHTLDTFLIVLEVTLVLLVSNAVAILASVSYPPAYRGIGPPPYLILLGLPVLSVILTAIIPITLLLSYPFTTLTGVILALLVFCFLRVTSVSVRALILIIPISLLLLFNLATLFDITFVFMLVYVFVVVTSSLKRAEKSFTKLEEFWNRY